MQVPEHIGDAIVSYAIHKNDIYGNVPEAKSHYDLLDVVMICMGESVMWMKKSVIIS